MDDSRTAVRIADNLRDSRPQPSQRPDLGDCQELIVVGGQPETDLRQGLVHRQAGFGEHPQVGHRGGDAAGELPRRVGAEIVERGPVDGDRPHTVVVGQSRCHADDFPQLGRGTLAERRSKWVGPQVDRQDCALIGLDAADQFEQGVAGGPIIGAGIENHRCHAQVNAFEHLLQLCGQYTGLPHPHQQRADTLAERGEHRGVDLLRRHPDHPVGRNGLGDPPPGLDVAQPIGATQVGPLARQWRLGQLIERGVQRPDRDRFVGRGFQHLLGLRPECCYLSGV